jgi:anion-transporting  ArsA/GET3 family ATPase
VLLERRVRSAGGPAAPCTEEIAVFRAFAQAIAQGEDGFVILDTAPTGHTLLLLDAAEACQREVSRTRGAVPESVRQLLPRLRDREFTKVLLVTLPEATAVHEAAQLQEDLRRAGIEPFAWVVNQSFADAGITDPVLRERGAREQPYLMEVQEQLANRVAWDVLRGVLVRAKQAIENRKDACSRFRITIRSPLAPRRRATWRSRATGSPRFRPLHRWSLADRATDGLPRL